MRSGFCAIVGRPNVGKSTFLNRVLGQKIAAVTPKPQTTRHRIRGVRNVDGAQIVFVDTPGVHRGKSELNKYMVDQALAAAADTDVILMMIEAPLGRGGEGSTAIGPGQQLIVDALKKLDVPMILAINKVDRVRGKAALLPVIARWKDVLPWRAVIPLSAESGEQAELVVQTVAALLPEGPELYPRDMVTDRQERFLAAEAVREQIFLLLKEEVPYDAAVTVEKFDERRGKAGREVAIDATIHLARESQKKIVIGKGGAGVKQIGVRARGELADMLGCPVHLKLLVAVDPDWTSRPSALKRLGYE